MNDQPKQETGSFAKGCLAVAIASVALALIVGVGGWFLYGKLVDRFTSDQPSEIWIDPPTETQYQEAENALNRLRQAIANDAEATIEFTTTDLNVLVVRDPDFARVRGRVRTTLANSIVILDMSVPLDSVPLPKLKGRWFNGRVDFGFGYALNQFEFEVESAESRGYRFPESVLQRFSASFARNFNSSFHESLGKNPNGKRFWSRIQRIGVEGDKLIVTTRPGS